MCLCLMKRPNIFWNWKKKKSKSKTCRRPLLSKVGGEGRATEDKSLRKAITRILTRLKRKQYERGEDREYRQVLKKNNERK